jgi:hypothetical protein
MGARCLREKASTMIESSSNSTSDAKASAKQSRKRRTYRQKHVPETSSDFGGYGRDVADVRADANNNKCRQAEEGEPDIRLWNPLVDGRHCSVSGKAWNNKFEIYVISAKALKSTEQMENDVHNGPHNDEYNRREPDGNQASANAYSRRIVH